MMLPDVYREKRFLICDDYPSMQQMMKTSLVGLGVEKILIANSGNEGYKIIMEHFGKPTSIDFVVTDLVMPDGTGIELTTQIRATPYLDKLPVLMVTSKTEVPLVVQSTKAGVTNFVVKPWTLEELKKKIIASFKKFE